MHVQIGVGLMENRPKHSTLTDITADVFHVSASEKGQWNAS